MDPSGICRLKFADYGSFDYGRNYGVMYESKAGPICCLNLAVTLIPMQKLYDWSSQWRRDLS